MWYSFRLAAMVLLYVSSHKQDKTYHSLCYTSQTSELEWEIAQWVHHEGSIWWPIAPWANAFTTELHLAPPIDLRWSSNLVHLEDASSCSLPNSMLSGQRSRCNQLLLENLTKSWMLLVTNMRKFVDKVLLMWLINYCAWFQPVFVY